jgi:hypothetical protein
MGIAGDMESYARCSGGGDGGLAFEDDDTVGQICGHDEIVLNDEGCLLGMQDESRPNNQLKVAVHERSSYRLMTLLAIIRCSESRKLPTDQ